MKRYFNAKTNEWYTEGCSFTQKTGKTLFSGIPSEEQLKEWGFEEYIPTTISPSQDELAKIEMAKIKAELESMDYLTSKYIDGEDMSEYGDWQERRKALREEYRQLENQLIK